MNSNVKSDFKNIFKFIKPNILKIVVSLICVIGEIIISVYQPLIIGELINNMIEKSLLLSEKLLLLVFILMIATFIISNFGNFVNGSVAIDIQFNLRKALFNDFIKKKQLEFESENGGNFITVMDSDIQEIVMFITEKIAIVLDIIKVVFIGVILLRLNVILAFIMFISFPLNLISFYIIGKFISKIQFELKLKIDNYNLFIRNILNGFLLIKAYIAETFFCRKFERINNEIYHISFKALKLDVISDIIGNIINFGVYLLFGIISFQEIMNGQLTIGIFIAFNSYSMLFNTSLYKITQLNSDIQKVMVSIRRVCRILKYNDRGNLDHIDNKIVKLDKNKSEVLRVYNLNFSYSNNIVLKNINFTVQKGQLILIKGKNGAGKSTLLKILSNIYENYLGDVKLYGENIKVVCESDIKKNIAYVTQDNFFFNMSIKDNLKMVKEVTDKDIIKICKMVGIHEYIESLENKYDTCLGEQNINLSGGQIQKLCLCRALLKNPDIYLLDEVTASLDRESRKKIYDLLVKLKKKGKTIIITCHDNEISNSCDKIINL